MTIRVFLLASLLFAAGCIQQSQPAPAPSVTSADAAVDATLKGMAKPELPNDIPDGQGAVATKKPATWTAMLVTVRGCSPCAQMERDLKANGLTLKHMGETGEANVWVIDANHPVAKRYVDIECGAVFPQLLVVVNGQIVSRTVGARPASEVRGLLAQGAEAFRMAQE